MNTSEKIKVAVLGCGGRSQTVVNNLLRDSNRQVRIAAIFDPDPAVMETAAAFWNEQDAIRCKSYQEAIQSPGIEWVMVFSPNANHCEQVVFSFKAGKKVFSEKPLATTIEDCQLIYDTYKETNAIFATGFVLRYSPLYRTAKEILDSGKIGRLLAINADENIAPAHGSYIMRNWRRHVSRSGPHILEKCCHDLDLINWYCGSLPRRVAAFGGLDFFIPANEKIHDKYGEKVFDSWTDPHTTKESAFMSDKDLMDNQVCIAQYRNGIKVTFQATMSNEMPERRIYFCCTEGTMILELYSSSLCYKVLGEKERHVLDFGADGHGGGDDYIMKELFEVMTRGGTPKCSGNEGLESAVFAMALDKAMRTNQVIDMEPIWQKLNR